MRSPTRLAAVALGGSAPASFDGLTARSSNDARSKKSTPATLADAAIALLVYLVDQYGP